MVLDNIEEEKRHGIEVSAKNFLGKVKENDRG